MFAQQNIKIWCENDYNEEKKYFQSLIYYVILRERL